MEHIRHFPCALGDIAFDRMRQSVHTGGSRKPFGHRSHHFGIHHSHYGNIVHVYTHEFTLLFHVGDYVVDGNFRSRACRRGNGDRGNGGFLGGRNAFQRTHVGEFGVVDDNADRFRGVHRRAAADRDDAIRLALLIRRHARLNVFDRGVGFNIGIQFVSDSRLFENVRHLFRYAEFHKIGVGAHKRFFQASAFDFPGDLRDATRAVITRFIEYDSCHFLFLLS